MKDEYDFTKARKNPYAKKLKQQITINIDVDTIDYFKEQYNICDSITCGLNVRLRARIQSSF